MKKWLLGRRRLKSRRKFGNGLFFIRKYWIISRFFYFYFELHVFSVVAVILCLKLFVRLLFSTFRWEEEKKPEGIKWKSLSHKGPLFAPPYVPLPDSVKFSYDGKVG